MKQNQQNKTTIEITIHAIERFYERVLMMKQGENNTYKGIQLEERNHINNIILDDIITSHPDSVSIQDGIYSSKDYNCSYVMRKGKIVTTITNLIEENYIEEYREVTPEDRKTDKKKSYKINKSMKKSFNTYKKKNLSNSKKFSKGERKQFLNK